MNAPHGTFRSPPWYKLRTHKQRRRYLTLARRAGVNPDWVFARFELRFALCNKAYTEFMFPTHTYEELLAIRAEMHKTFGAAPATPIA